MLRTGFIRNAGLLCRSRLFGGLLAVGGLTVALAVTAPGAAWGAVELGTFTVPASSPNWLDTGLNLSAGASDTLSVAGNGTCHVGGASDCPVGNPHGAGFTCAGSPFGNFPPGPAGPTIPYGALAGKINANGTPFLVGPGVTVTGPGELFLVFNDCNPPMGYSDNAGSYAVSVSGTPPNASDSPPPGFRPGPRLGVSTFNKHFVATPASARFCFLSSACYVRSGAIVTFCNHQVFPEHLYSQARPNKFNSGTIKSGRCFRRRFVNMGKQLFVVRIYSELHPNMRFLLWVAPGR
jgi:hypothetical protein